MGIYIVRADKDGPIKIGFTSDTVKRMWQLRSANFAEITLLAVIDGDRKKEKSLHHRFAKLHLRGEWFRPDSELLAFIATLPPAPVEARKNRKREKTELWKTLSEDQLGYVSSIWFDSSVRTDVEAAKIVGLNVITIKNNLGPSGRPGKDMYPQRAKDMQAASVKARTKGRMGEREALIIWRDPGLTVIEKIDRMRGWSQGTAYRVLGKCGVPAGRRSGKKD